MLATTVAPVAPRLSDDEVKSGLTDIDGMRARTETLTLHGDRSPRTRVAVQEGVDRARLAHGPLPLVGADGDQ